MTMQGSQQCKIRYGTSNVVLTYSWDSEGVTCNVLCYCAYGYVLVCYMKCTDMQQSQVAMRMSQDHSVKHKNGRLQLRRIMQVRCATADWIS